MYVSHLRDVKPAHFNLVEVRTKTPSKSKFENTVHDMQDRMAAAGAMLTAIFTHAADRSGLKAD
jgi:hypothetical protein